MSFGESSEAWLFARNRHRDVRRLGHVDPEGLWGHLLRHIQLPLQVPADGSGCRRTADQRDRSDACALWLQARSRASETGGLGDQHEEDTLDLQRVGPAAQEQAPEAPGEGKAPRRPSGSRRAERCLGDALPERRLRKRNLPEGTSFTTSSPSAGGCVS